MPTGKGVAMTAIAVTVVALLFGPITGAVNTSSGLQTVNNETVTAEYDVHVDLEGYDIETGTVDVYAVNNTGVWKEVPENEYEIDYQPGTILVYSNSTTIMDGDTIRVTYDYQATSETTATVVGQVPLLVALLMLVVLAASATHGGY